MYDILPKALGTLTKWKKVSNGYDLLISVTVNGDNAFIGSMNVNNLEWAMSWFTQLRFDVIILNENKFAD